MLPSHPCGGCHCQLCLCQGILPHLVSLVRLFCQPLSGSWLSSFCQSQASGWSLSLPSFWDHPSRHLCISSPSSGWCESSSFSAAAGPFAEDLVLAGSCPHFSAFWFPPRCPSLSPSSAHSCGNGFLRSLAAFKRLSLFFGCTLPLFDLQWTCLSCLWDCHALSFLCSPAQGFSNLDVHGNCP